MNLTRHKKTKFGMLPGEVPKQTKIAMLERLEHPAGQHPAKRYKKIFVTKANRRTRHRAKQEIANSTDGI